MTLEDFLDALERLLDYIEDYRDYQELWERIQNLRDGNSEPSELWHLLGDILRKLAEKAPLPPQARRILNFAIDAIEATIESNVGLTLHVLCRRYFQYRESGMSHDEAAGYVTSDAMIRQWLLLKWLSGSCERTESDEETTEGETGGDESTSDSGEPPHIYVAPGPTWDSRDHKCCAPPPDGSGGGAVAPSITFSQPVWSSPPGHFVGKLLTITVKFEHPCGPGEGSVRVWLVNGGRYIRLSPSNTAHSGGFRITRHGQWNSPETSKDLEIYATGEVVIVAKARSRCHTRALEQLRLTVP